MKRLLISFLLLTGCGHENFTSTIMLDYSNPEIKKMSPDFQKGWRDGCETGVAVYGNPFYKFLNNPKRDSSKVGNRSYQNAWSTAYNYCRRMTSWWENDGWGVQGPLEGGLY